MKRLLSLSLAITLACLPLQAQINTPASTLNFKAVGLNVPTAPVPHISVEYVIQAGGGSGYTGNSIPYIGKGGNAGQYLTGSISLTAGTYAAVIAATTAVNANGNNSSIFGLTATGGGAGALWHYPTGGSAAGGNGTSSSGQPAPDFNTGGDGGHGTDPFGVGLFPSLGGGGGGAGDTGGGSGGSGATDGVAEGNSAANATANTGSAGGGGWTEGGGDVGGQGASGRIIVRILTASLSGWTVTGGSVTVSGSYTYYDITASGNLVISH